MKTNEMALTAMTLERWGLALAMALVTLGK